MFLIDSDILIALERGKTSIQDKMNSCGIDKCIISEISLAELYVGVYKKRRHTEELFLQFLEKNITIVPISPAIKLFARLRAQLENLGYSLDKMDLFIAATALAGDHTLVTHNTKHFSRIPGLIIEDWLED